jgi:hypothetical protein
MRALALTVLSLSLATDVPAPEESTVVEMGDLHGAWVVTKFVYCGETWPERDWPLRRLVFGRVAVEGLPPAYAPSEAGWYKADLAHDPPRIVFGRFSIFEPDGQSPPIEYGIIRVWQDKMTLAYSHQARPKSFVSEPGAFIYLVTLRREKK